MQDWLETAATALGVDPVDDETQERLLGVARDVAHGVERKLTPIATFLLGEAVQRRIDAGEEPPRRSRRRWRTSSGRSTPTTEPEPTVASASSDRLTFPPDTLRERCRHRKGIPCRERCGKGPSRSAS